MDTQTRKVIEGAREILADPARWTKGTAARGKHGDEVPSLSQFATCFCILGALHLSAHRVIGQNYDPTFHIAADIFDELTGGPFKVGGWNDAEERTHDEVLALFDKVLGGAA